MDVTSWFLRRTAPRPLLITAPGGTEARLAVERVARERGWRLAMSPAQANTLIVAGTDHPFEAYVRRVWVALPAPRVRVDVPTAADAARELDAVLAVLHDAERQRTEAARATHSPEHAEHARHNGHESSTVHAAHDDHQASHDQAVDPPQHDHENQATHAGDANQANPAEHGDHGEGSGHHMGHGGHDHHMSGMELPGGMPMADRAEDRDGLTLDQLNLPLGPALPLWPAGLIVHTRIQGDVIQHASVELLTKGHGSFWAQSTEHNAVARRLDSCYRLLAVAGWEDAAVTAQRLRDDALTGNIPDVRRWAARVRRSRTLRWLLSGVGAIPEGGDALDRLHGWLDAVAEPSNAPDVPGAQWTVDALPALLEGAELATARLIVASLDPDLDLLATHEVHHA